MIAERQTQARVNRYADIASTQREITESESTANALTFTLHFVPLGAATDYWWQEKYDEMALAAAGDVATLIAGPLARVSTAGRLGRSVKWVPGYRSQLNLSAALIETSVATVRLGQGAVALYRDNSSDAAGYLGEAGLRLLGLAIRFRPLPVDPSTLKEVNLKGIIKGYGMVLADEGDFFGWTPTIVTKSARDFTRDGLLARGWTRERVEQVAIAYENIARITPTNPSAANRAVQFRDILDRFFFWGQ